MRLFWVIFNHCEPTSSSCIYYVFFTCLGLKLLLRGKGSSLQSCDKSVRFLSLKEFLLF